MATTADALLAEIRRSGSLSSVSVVGLEDADLFAHADSELVDTLVPLMLGAQEELYQRVFNQTIVAGTAPYRINKRAALSRLNTVAWINSDGTGRNLVRLDPKRVLELSVLTTQQGVASHYYLEGSRVVLWPTPSAAGTLRIRAFVRPSRMCLTTAGASTALAVTAVSVGSTLTTLTTAAHGITTSGVRDVVAATPSYEHLAVDSTATVASSTTVTIPNVDFTTAPEVGDWMCASDQAPVIQLPRELHPALVELTVARILRALGKRAEAKDHADEATRLVGIGIQALTPRVDTADRKIVGGPHFRNRGPIGWGGQ